MKQTDGASTKLWLRANKGKSIVAYIGEDGQTDSVQLRETEFSKQDDENPLHREDFDAVLTKAACPTKQRRT